jgi:spermidine/putrescine transport system substrate-binding protein
MLPKILMTISVLMLISLVGCQAEPPLAPTPPPLAKTLVFYDWAGYMPQAILDAFHAEYGVEVSYLVYETQEEAIADMRAGQVYDVVVMGDAFIPGLVKDDLLAEIDYQNVPNFKNVSANFRDLAFDPGNKHSIPIQWGTSGLVVRSDLVQEPVTHWADLWDPRYQGKVGVWMMPRELMSISLKSLGYSANSEDPAELEAVLKRLLELKANSFQMDLNLATAASYLVSGEAVMVYGWPYDAIDARQQNDAVTYVLPEEGSLLWSDHLVIPANSTNKYTAEIFLNFLLRPEISAQMINETYTATPNEAARPLVQPDILNDPIIFPPNEVLQKAELILPLSPAGEQLYNKVWEQFLATPDQQEVSQ